MCRPVPLNESGLLFKCYSSAWKQAVSRSEWYPVFTLYTDFPSVSFTPSQLPNYLIFSNMLWKIHLSPHVSPVKNLWRMRDTSLRNRFCTICAYRCTILPYSVKHAPVWKEGMFHNIWLKIKSIGRLWRRETFNRQKSFLADVKTVFTRLKSFFTSVKTVLSKKKKCFPYSAGVKSRSFYLNLQQ